jgi:hypothetical protein
MLFLAQSVRTYVRTLSEIPDDFSRWVTSLSDSSYLGIMFFGAVLLTFVIARALR